jgi:hypothetical protein
MIKAQYVLILFDFFCQYFSEKNNYTWDETTAVVGSNTAGVVGVGGC